MKVWPFGAGLQKQAPNYLELLWSKAMVVNVKEKVQHDCIRYGYGRRTIEPLLKYRKRSNDVKTEVRVGLWISPREICLLLGRRPVCKWRDPYLGSCMERGNLCFAAKGEIQVEDPLG
jgi:hypothetical protein